MKRCVFFLFCQISLRLVNCTEIDLHIGPEVLLDSAKNEDESRRLRKGSLTPRHRLLKEERRTNRSLAPKQIHLTNERKKMKNIAKNSKEEKQGQIPTSPQIVGGTNAQPGQYPYYASVTFTNYYLCGASLVAPDLLLSAAHCNPAFPKNTPIIINSTIARSSVPGSVTVVVNQQVIHPKYKVFAEYDLMLLKVSPPVTTITPIQINSDPTLPSIKEKLEIIGFGYTEPGLGVAQVLQEAQVSEVPTASCQPFFQGSVKLSPTKHLCVWNENPLRVTCGGDSGGPLLGAGSTNSQLLTYGVLSFGAKNCTTAPSVFTRLSGYWQWLQSTICSLSASPPSYLKCSSKKPHGGGGGGGGGGGPCKAVQRRYGSCFSKVLKSSKVKSCVQCVNNALPSKPQSCNDFQAAVCSATKSCGCSKCGRDIANWIKCASNCDSAIMSCSMKKSKKKKKKKKTKKKRKKNCKSRKQKCSLNQQCCSGRCSKGKCRG